MIPSETPTPQRPPYQAAASHHGFRLEVYIIGASHERRFCHAADCRLLIFFRSRALSPMPPPLLQTWTDLRGFALHLVLIACVCVRMCTYTFVCICMCMRARLDVYMQTCACARACARACVHYSSYTNARPRASIDACACIMLCL